MKRSFLASNLSLSSALLLMLISSAEAHLDGHKLDDAQCSAAWAKVSPSGNAISYEQAAPYVVEPTIIDMEGDSTISFEEFTVGCVDGYMKSADEVAKAMEMQKPPPTPTDKEFERIVNSWDAAGTEARQRFLEFIGK